MAPTAVASRVSIDVLRSPEGCVGYLVVDGTTRSALAIDPRLDQVTLFQEKLRSRDARLAFAMDTHTHADHMSGVRRLAEATGAQVLAHASSKLKTPARRLEGGATFELGSTSVHVLHAAGHTPDSLAVLVGEHLFTGDSLFVGGAGRTDFMGGSASELYDTFRRYDDLPDTTIVHPGHDYVNKPETTIGEEKKQNPLYSERDRSALETKLASKAPPPANMEEILRYNLGTSDANLVSPAEAAALRSSGAVFVDVRSPLEFESEKIEGSLNIPLADLEARLGEISESADILVVCRTGVRSLGAAQTLGRAGRKARVVEGGIARWRQAGLALQEGKKRLPIDRQVQLIVGISVLTSAILGFFVSPYFLGIAAFFGAGLTFAGASGTCGLALVLGKMPWNKLDLPASASCAAPSCSAGR
jgi:glyoxylase-like metal-dependent hydrolase (beta-lactamase superfamily II)